MAEGQATATLLVGVIIAVLSIAVNCQENEITSEVCGLPSETGPCKAHMIRYFYNVESAACEQFVYGGCLGNANNFKSREECEKSCNPRVVCNASPEAGPCYAYFPSFFYNSTSGKCERFVYGGCQGNANRFGTEQQCNNKCVCSQPKEIGDYCKAKIPAFYYNAQNRRCEPFYYRGCGGNSNRFYDVKTCLETCGGY
ncbi:hypothetical protein EMCRGX_G003301 [Ephydatia muelleri]